MGVSAKTSEILAKYDVSKIRKASAEAIATAQDFMYLAEGSDWFWWYGSDQDSGRMIILMKDLEHY